MGKLRYFTFQCRLLSNNVSHHFIYVVHDTVDDPINEIKLHLAAQALDESMPLHVQNLPYLYKTLEDTRDEEDT